MASPYYSAFFTGGDNTPSRSTSAPPKLDSQMIFAYPVSSSQVEYTTAFGDIRNDARYEEFYERYKKSIRIPPPLDVSEELAKLPEAPDLKFLDENEMSARSRRTSLLVSNVVNSCIREEDSPCLPTNRADTTLSFSSASATVPEFLPAGTFPLAPPGFFFEQDFSPYENIYAMSKDQMGCRLLQKRLDERNAFAIQTVYSQIYQYIPELMTDPFGNYLCQKLMEVCNETQLESMVKLVHNHLIHISLDQHGTRAAQKLIEVTNTIPRLAMQVVNALKKDPVTLIKSVNGNHVVQRCLNVMGAPYDQFIFEAASECVVDVATHRHGCCVLQRCLDSATPEQKRALVNKIVENAVPLVQDAFGNYVVQYVLDLNIPDVNARLAQIFTDRMLELSQQKFSSNVIEKCLQLNTHEVQMIMIVEIGKPVNLAHMLLDQYANYGNS